MIIEFPFFRHNLNLKAGEIQDRIEKRFSQKQFKQDSFTDFEIKNVTVMSKWLVVLVEFKQPKEKKELTRADEEVLDAFAGEIVIEFIDYGIRYRKFEIHGETRSLIYHKEWEKDKYK